MFTETLNFLSVLFPSSLHYWPLMVKNFYSWVQLAHGKKAICYISWRRGKILNKKPDISTQRTFIYRTGSTKIFLLTLTDSHNAKSLPRQSNSLEVNEVVLQRISYNAPFSLGASLPVRQRQQLGEALSLQTRSPPCFTFSFIMMIFVLEQFAFDITSFLLHSGIDGHLYWAWKPRITAQTTNT